MPISSRSPLARHLWSWLLLVLLLGACAAVVAGDKVAKPDEVAPAGLYSTIPEPMTTAECGRCHLHHFSDLRQDGGAHRFACQDCHQVIHAYNPRRNNFAELMPACAQCHEPFPHGEQITECLDCHNPHAPRVIPSPALANLCGDCHKPVDVALREAISAHTEQGCVACHSQRHGKSPACAECHQPHLPAQQESACRQCHPAHQPLRIDLAASDDAATCAVCHADVHGRWAATPSRHGEVSCGSCHLSHRQVPACADCHSNPHDEKMLSKFPDCLTCHGDVHDLPVKR